MPTAEGWVQQVEELLRGRSSEHARSDNPNPQQPSSHQDADSYGDDRWCGALVDLTRFGGSRSHLLFLAVNPLSSDG